MLKKVNTFEFEQIYRNKKKISTKKLFIIIAPNNNIGTQKYGITFLKKSKFKKNLKKKIKRSIYFYLNQKSIQWTKNFIIIIKKYSFAKDQRSFAIFLELLNKKIIYKNNR